MIVEEKTLSSQRIYEGTILNLRKDKVTVREGRTSYREIVEHNGGVAIAAITDQGRIVMVKQFRKAAESVVLEVPAGKIDPGEGHRITAIRELKEETGYTAANMEHIYEFYSSIGYSTEVIHLYLATDLTPGMTDFDENEEIEILEFTVDELLEMMKDGRIVDAKTIVAIQMIKLRQIEC
ncbi:ADP-ribose pyrophosphatase [Clostridia bacterium]|nr:ADP-ribose pyrophosphatase [Clostridia bacterium]